MAREPIPTWYFALVVVRRGHRFLAVREVKHGQLWYLPAGRVEPGESLAEGARREVLEETGVPVVLEGIFRIEHTPQPTGSARCRVFFVARAVDDRPPRDEPNDDSLEARWVTLDELACMPLRGREVLDIFRYVADGGPIYPMSLLKHEGDAFVRVPG
jgi:8-oxo-dGTP pyrophosphatase MutT (NUDIX family)